MVTKKKVVKKGDDYVIIGERELETFTKRIRARFPKDYKVWGVIKLGHVIVEDSDGMHVAEISFNDNAAQRIFGK